MSVSECLTLNTNMALLTNGGRRGKSRVTRASHPFAISVGRFKIS
jgi:hypothetical protein